MPRAFSYIRFSTAEQSKGDSLRRQTSAAEAWAKAAGVELDERLTDAGLSAYHGRNRERGALGTFLAAVEAGTIERGSILLVESLDRLSRETVLDALAQLQALIRAGIEVVTLADGQRYSRATIEADWTKLIISVSVMARANEESERKSRRVRAAWEQKKRGAQERALTAMCPGWLRIEDGKYTIIPKHAATARRIFEMCAGGIGQDTIARVLNREGTEHFGRSQVGWYPSYIKKILNSRAAIGFYQPRSNRSGSRVLDGDEMAGVYPAVIAESLFHAAHAAIAVRRSRKPGRVAVGYSNLLAGLAQCACGRPMNYINKSKRRGEKHYDSRYLVCDGLRRGTGCDAESGWWPYEKAEGLVLARVRHVDFRALNRAEADATAATRAVADGLAAAAEKAQRRHRALLTAFGEDSDEAAVAEIRSAAADVKRLAAEAAEAAGAAAQMSAAAGAGDRAAELENLRTAISSDDETERVQARARVQQELRRIIERLEFSRDDIALTYRQPGADVTGFKRVLGYQRQMLVHPPRPVHGPADEPADAVSWGRRPSRN